MARRVYEDEHAVDRLAHLDVDRVGEIQVGAFGRPKGPAQNMIAIELVRAAEDLMRQVGDL